MRIGFIGLGQMGGAIAANLIKAGHEVTVWNRSTDKADALVDAGAVRAARPVDAAQGDLVMTMLADALAVESVVFGKGGIVGAPALHVGHSTISIALAGRLAEDSGTGGTCLHPSSAVHRRRRRASCSWSRQAWKLHWIAANRCSPISVSGLSGSATSRPRPTW